ncbi:hypothetical protein ACIQFZ_24725 [Streptomyces sp. NPDC093064]|uniref:hypothetical protein n=1 Tax=unclassified Streptomyces TaxID=2593676 RepID=UPI003686356D
MNGGSGMAQGGGGNRRKVSAADPADRTPVLVFAYEGVLDGWRTGDLTHRPAGDVSITVPVAEAPTSIALTAPAEATLSGGVAITRGGLPVTATRLPSS